MINFFLFNKKILKDEKWIAISDPRHLKYLIMKWKRKFPTLGTYGTKIS